jgi:hypothetical protein
MGNEVFASGSRVRVISYGPFRGLRGTIQKVDTIPPPDGDEPFCFYHIELEGIHLKEPIWFQHDEVEMASPEVDMTSPEMALASPQKKRSLNSV